MGINEHTNAGAALGRVDEAVELFAELVDNRPPAIWSLDAWGLLHDPIYHGLHEDLRFVAKAKELESRTSEVLSRVRADIPELFVVDNAGAQ